MDLRPYQIQLQSARETARVMWHVYEGHMARKGASDQTDWEKKRDELFQTCLELENCVASLERGIAHLEAFIPRFDSVISLIAKEQAADEIWYGESHPQVLYTLPHQDAATGLSRPSERRVMRNRFYLQMEVGDVTLCQHFGPHFPETKRSFTSLDGKIFARLELTTEPNGEGDLVGCWERIK